MTDLPGLDGYDVLVNLKPGDVVVLRLKEGRLNPDRAKLMREMLQDRAPGIEWLVLDSSLDLSVLRPAQPSPLLCRHCLRPIRDEERGCMCDAARVENAAMRERIAQHRQRDLDSITTTS